jgi:hypothetical protein
MTGMRSAIPRTWRQAGPTAAIQGRPVVRAVPVPMPRPRAVGRTSMRPAGTCRQAPRSCPTLRSLARPGQSGAGRARASRAAEGNAWTLIEPCAYGCLPAGTVCNECRPSTKECTGPGKSSARTCGPDGRWLAAEPCSAGCLEGLCKGCAAGDWRCDGEGERTCLGATGAWSAPQACSLGCAVGSRRCRVCDPTATPTRCSSDGSMQERCLDDGSAWAAATSCNGKGCQAGRCNQCAPGMDRQCTGAGGTSSQVCQADGTWGTPQSCPDGCAGGVCKACPTMGQTRCVSSGGARVETCSPSGCGPRPGPARWAAMPAAPTARSTRRSTFSRRCLARTRATSGEDRVRIRCVWRPGRRRSPRWRARTSAPSSA